MQYEVQFCRGGRLTPPLRAGWKQWQFIFVRKAQDDKAVAGAIKYLEEAVRAARSANPDDS